MSEPLLPGETSAEHAEEGEAFRTQVDRIETELGRAIVGQRRAIRELLVAILGGGHVLLEGVPGLGKTLLARSLADCLGLGFSRIQCTPDLIPADVTGTNVLIEDERGGREIRFQPGPIFARVVLADEINRATPRTQSAFLEAMEERQVTISGRSHPLPGPFTLLATENPIEMEGTFPLPEAQLDRFLLKVLIDFPDHEELCQIVRQTTGPPRPPLREVTTPDRVVAMQSLVRRVPIANDLVEGVARLVRATHPGAGEAPEDVRRFVRFGASPRAAQALILSAKAHALVAGRSHVGRSDLLALVPAVLRHRLILGFDATAAEVDIDRIVIAIAESTLS